MSVLQGFGSPWGAGCRTMRLLIVCAVAHCVVGVMGGWGRAVVGGCVKFFLTLLDKLL